MDLFDASIAFGLTPFETIYFSDKKPQRLNKHYRRLLRAKSVFGTSYSDSFNEFKENIEKYILGQDENDGVLKAVLLEGKLHFKIRDAGYNKEGFNKGMSLCISSIKRDPKSIFTYFKTLNYGENVLEDRRAKGRGHDGSLFLNYNNEVCETSYANIFFRKGNTFYTPHLRCGILPGVMRNDIIDFARKSGYKVEKSFLTLSDIENAEEAFISNSVLGVYPVKSIGNTVFHSREFVELVVEKEEFQRPWNS